MGKAIKSQSKSLGDGFKNSVNHGKVKDVTVDNYAGKASAVANARGGEEWGVMLCPLDTPNQWGAWADYFKRMGRGGARMKQCGQERANSKNGNGYWVPTEWPHTFDSDRLEISDTNAGNMFVEAQEKARAAVDRSGTEAQRLAQAERAHQIAKKGLQFPPHHNWRKETVKARPAPGHDPKRWQDPEELRASRDRLLKLNNMDPVDTSDIPEEGEEFFQRAKLRKPGQEKHHD